MQYRLIVEDVECYIDKSFSDIELREDYKNKTTHILDNSFVYDFAVLISGMSVHCTFEVPLNKIKIAFIDNICFKYMSFDSIDFKQYFNYRKILIDTTKMMKSSKEKDQIVDIRDYDTKKILISSLHLSNVCSSFTEQQHQDFADGCNIFELPFKVLQNMSNKPYSYGNVFV